MTNLVFTDQTSITLPNGEPVTGIKSVVINTTTINGVVWAVLTVDVEPEAVDVHPLLSIRTLEQWAGLQGMRLVPIEAAPEEVVETLTRAETEEMAKRVAAVDADLKSSGTG